MDYLEDGRLARVARAKEQDLVWVVRIAEAVGARACGRTLAVWVSCFFAWGEESK